MTRLVDLARRGKVVLPAGTRTRTLPVGIGRGLRLGLDLRAGHIGLFLGLYEMELNRHLRRLCYRDARSFDIGGSIGYDALVMAKLSQAEVLTVEASPGLCEAIRGNVRANPELESLVTVLQAFVDQQSELRDHVTIDELATAHFTPDFIKVDIEGGECDALLGAEHVLGERHPGLLIEVHSAQLEDDCLQILRRHGYEPLVVSQRRIMPDHRPLEHNRWLVAYGNR